MSETHQFSPQNIYQACNDISARRLWVEQNLGYPTGEGNFWLPIVLTAKGPLYCEVIGLAAEVSTQELSADGEKSHQLKYRQPVHLSDVWRQQLYQLGYKLLQSLSATPATYLLQFGFEDRRIVFDRLWPFPAAPAVASIGVQTPDLFTCHWYCLIGKPIFDLTIKS